MGERHFRSSIKILQSVGHVFENLCRTQLHQTLNGNRNWFDIAGVRYIRAFIKANQIKRRSNTVPCSGGALYPVFDITEFTIF